MMELYKTAFTFSDIQIEDQYSEVASRKTDVDITTDLGKFKLRLPVIASNMPDICEYKMAIEMCLNGGLGILHRFMSIEENIRQFKLVKESPVIIESLPEFIDNTEDYLKYCCGISIGVNEEEKKRFDRLYEAGARIITIDIAHGHAKNMKDMIQWVRSRADDIVVIAGNIANGRSALDMAEWGVQIAKVGIGPGCFIKGTKIKTKDGYKNIEDIRVGDMVLTHRGRYKEVVETTNRKENNEIYSINNEKCTGNHEFYVVHKKYKNVINDDNIEQYAEWIPADRLTKEYLLLKNKYELIEIEEISAKKFDGTVYDFEVKDDHSYTVNDVIVHNSVCRTRSNTGVGKPQFSALKEVYEALSGAGTGVKIIADGGLKEAGDFGKALIYADACMIGAILSGSAETPGNVYPEPGTNLTNRQYYKMYGGSASAENKRKNGQEGRFVEGEMKKVPFKGHAKYLLREIEDGLKSTLSYNGSKDLKHYKETVQWYKISSGGKTESKF